jgi:hypothetical protein
MSKRILLTTSALLLVSTAQAQQTATVSSSVTGYVPVAGANVSSQLDAACAALGGGHGYATIPGSMGGGWTAAGIPENCLIIDYRGTGVNATGNYTAGYVNGVLYAGYWTSPLAGERDTQTLEVYASPIAGGVNINNGPKSNYASILAVMASRTNGQTLGYENFNYHYGNGDTVVLAGTAISWGRPNAAGDEGTEGTTIGAYKGNVVMTATVTTINNNGVLNYDRVSASNDWTRGEGRPLIITTPSKTYTVGTITSVSGTPPIITGNNTNWDTQFGIGQKTDLFLRIDSMTTGRGGLETIVPIASVDSATQITLSYQYQGVNVSITSPGTLPSTYAIFKGGIVTGVSQLPGTITIDATTTTSDFAPGDTIEEPLGYNGKLVGGHFNIGPLLPGDSAIGLQVSNNTVGVTAQQGIGVNGDFIHGIYFTGNAQAFLRFNDNPSVAAVQSNVATANAIIPLLGVYSNAGPEERLQYNRQTDFWSVGKNMSIGGTLTVAGINILTSINAIRNEFEAYRRTHP